MIKINIPAIAASSVLITTKTDISKDIHPTLTKDNDLIIDQSAINRLQYLKQKRKNPTLKLRIRVHGGGCSGFKYKFEFTEDITSDDKVYMRSDCQFVVDLLSLNLLRGATLCYTCTPMESGFQLKNPHAKSHCGCGMSFTVRNV